MRVLEVDTQPLGDINKDSVDRSCGCWHSAFLCRDESGRSGKEKRRRVRRTGPLSRAGSSFTAPRFLCLPQR